MEATSRRSPPCARISGAWSRRWCARATAQCTSGAAASCAGPRNVRFGASRSSWRRTGPLSSTSARESGNGWSITTSAGARGRSPRSVLMAAVRARGGARPSRGPAGHAALRATLRRRWRVRQALPYHTPRPHGSGRLRRGTRPLAAAGRDDRRTRLRGPALQPLHLHAGERFRAHRRRARDRGGGEGADARVRGYRCAPALGRCDACGDDPRPARALQPCPRQPVQRIHGTGRWSRPRSSWWRSRRPDSASWDWSR